MSVISVCHSPKINFFVTMITTIKLKYYQEMFSPCSEISWFFMRYFFYRFFLVIYPGIYYSTDVYILCFYPVQKCPILIMILVYILFSYHISIFVFVIIRILLYINTFVIEFKIYYVYFVTTSNSWRVLNFCNNGIVNMPDDWQPKQLSKPVV